MTLRRRANFSHQLRHLPIDARYLTQELLPSRVQLSKQSIYLSSLLTDIRNSLEELQPGPLLAQPHLSSRHLVEQLAVTLPQVLLQFLANYLRIGKGEDRQTHRFSMPSRARSSSRRVSRILISPRSRSMIRARRPWRITVR